jgi:hypothetical protein
MPSTRTRQIAHDLGAICDHSRALGYTGVAMASSSVTQSPEQMLQILADGGEHLRESLVRQLRQLASQGSSALLTSLRDGLIKVLSADSHHRVDDEEHSGSWTRSWQVSALVTIAGDHAESRRLMDLYADIAQEPNRWIRYWSVATAYTRPEHAAWVKQRAAAIARDPREHLMLRCLGWALDVQTGDSPEALTALLWALAGGQAPFPGGPAYPFASAEPPAPVVARSAALRALRVVPLAQAFEQVELIVDEGPFASYTWDALTVLGRFGGTARAAEASHTLARFVVAKRRMREFYDMVGVAVRAIGRLGIPQTDLLIAELESASPGVAYEAAQALEVLLTTPQAVDRLLELATLSSERDDKLAAALRCMTRANVIDHLDANLRCGQTRREDAARRMLIEMGGSVAVDRAQVRRQDLESRRAVVAEFDVRQREHVKWIAMGDGIATWISVGMWVVVFGIGTVAIVLGMYMGYSQGFETFSSWAMVGTGGLFTALGKVGFQGRLVEVAGARAAARLAVFNAYQRRLQQVDLVLAQRFIDGVQVSPEELEKLSGLISAAQIETQESLLTLMPSEKELDAYQKRKATLGQAKS